MDKLIDNWCKENGITRQEFADAGLDTMSGLFRETFGITREEILGIKEEDIEVIEDIEGIKDFENIQFGFSTGEDPLKNLNMEDIEYGLNLLLDEKEEDEFGFN